MTFEDCDECKKHTQHEFCKDSKKMRCVICYPGLHPDWPKNLTDVELVDCVWSSDMFPEHSSALDEECKRREIDPFAKDKGDAAKPG